MDLLEQYPEKINGERLSHNPNPQAMNWLEQNPDEIDWYYLSSNPAIFLEEDYCCK